MKKLFFIFLFSISCFSQNTRINNSNPFLFGNVYDIEPHNIQEFTNVFYWDFYKNVDQFKNNDFIKLTFELFNSFFTKIYFKKIESYDITEATKAVAIARGMFDNCNVNIQIDYKKWMEIDNVKRLWIIYHELAHDVFNLRHGNGGPLMAPSLPNYMDEVGFIDARDELVEYVSKNNLFPPKCKKNYTDLDNIIN